MEEALELREQARKQGRSASGLLGKIKGSKKSQTQRKEAEDKYTQAATIFLREEKFHDAGDSFEEAAKLTDSVYTRAALTAEAARAWAQGNENERSAQLYAAAIAMFVEKGPLRRAALLAMDLGELYEKNSIWQPARNAYTRASNWFQENEEVSKAANAQLRAAHCAAWCKDYTDAIGDFEQAARKAAGDIGQRHKLKQYFLQAGLCYLASGDLVGLEQALKDKFVIWDRAFSATDQYKLLVALLMSVRQMDVPKFELALYQYDKKHRLDKWCIETCLLVKARIGAKDVNNPADELL